MSNHTSTLAIKLLDGVSGPAKGAAGALGAIGKATEAIGKVKGFREQTARLEEMSRAHVKARDTVKNLASQLISAEAPSNKLKAAYERATQAADKLGNKMDWQKVRVRGAASELERMGVAANNLSLAENRLQASIHRTTAALQRQEAAGLRSQRRRQAVGTMAAGGAAVVGYRARRFGAEAVQSAGSFDTAVRAQQFATDIKIAEQKRVLIPQAERIGQDTKFSNQDIVQAQTEFANGLAAQLKRADVIAPVIEQAKNYALTLKDVTMTDAAMAVRGFLLSLGKDISSPEKADKEARRASNMMIRSSKIGGLSHEDLQMFIQRGGSAGRLAGLTDETMLALAVGLKRSNISGDQAGTALRTASSKLVAPGRKQIDALNAAGINFGDYATMPGGGLSVDNFDQSFQTKFGRKLSQRARGKLQEVFEDEDIIGDVSKLTSSVQEALEAEFKKVGSGKNKGKISSADANKIAETTGKFWKLAIENVDSERLLQDIIRRDPSLGILNAFMTDKHGAKFGLIAKAFDQFGKDRADLANVSPDYGDKAAALLQGGLGGAINQLTGAVETFKLRLGSENESWLTPTINKMAGAVDWLTDRVKQNPATAAVAGGVGATAAAVGGTFKFLNDIVGGNAPAIALTASALALSKSALALDAAAATLAVGGKASALTSVAGAGAGTAGGIAAGVTAAGALAAGAIAAGIAIVIQDHKPAEPGVTKATAAPGQEHDEHLNRRKAATEAARQRILETRRQIEAIDGAGTEAGTEAGRNIPEAISSGITANSPKVEAASRSVMQRVMSIFGGGVDVPVRVSPSGVPTSPAVPSSPARGAPSPVSAAPAASKTASYAPSIRNNITVTTGSVDPQAIASAISKQVGEKTSESLRLAFTDTDFA